MQNGNLKTPIEGVILDWAGTAVDHGCRGPVAVFSRAFERFGIEPTIVECRKPMGLAKRAHVAAMLDMPRINEAWLAARGKWPDDRDVDLVFDVVGEIMPAVLADYAKPVPGCVEAIRKLRQMGIKIGSCTGYSRSMMSELLPKARACGFEPDCLVTTDEVEKGRPAPDMCRLNCERLGLKNPGAVIKVGDTLADIGEGLNAGHITVAVTITSNSLGLGEEEAAAMPRTELDAKCAELAKKFREAGAHYVLDSIADLPDLCAKLS